jgi:hypothetical protein
MDSTQRLHLDLLNFWFSTDMSGLQSLGLMLAPEQKERLDTHLSDFHSRNSQKEELLQFQKCVLDLWIVQEEW